MVDDDVRAGEELARAWLQGKSELIDDLAALVDGMTRPLDATARAFLATVGNAARLAPRGKARPTPTGTPAPARLEAQTAAQPTPEAPPAPAFDVDEFRRRRREHELAARLEELGRRNAEAFVGLQHAFAPRNQTRTDAEWRGW
jgi:hypothetical protein